MQHVDVFNKKVHRSAGVLSAAYTPGPLTRHKGSQCAHVHACERRSLSEETCDREQKDVHALNVLPSGQRAALFSR